MPKSIKVSEVPEMLGIWDFDENTLSPDLINVGSEEIYAWKHLEKNHTFHTSARSIRHGHGCSVCSGKEVLRGYNDLLTKQKELCQEWDYQKNNSNNGPENYTEYSSKEVYWKCKYCGHQWPAKIANRVKGTGCPNCSSSKQTSFPEQAILYYVRRYFTSCESHYSIGSKYTLDIFIGGINTAIEYDGYAWHRAEKSKIRDGYKDKYCKEKNIRLIRIRESKENIETSVEGDCITYHRDKYDSELNNVIKYVLTTFLGIRQSDRNIVDVSRSKKDIYKNYMYCLWQNSLEYNCPQIAKEWDEVANKPLTAKTISYHSNENVKWLCEKYQHSFEMTVDKRTSRNYQCPYCSGRRLLVGFNDFKTWCIQNQRLGLLNEWNDDREPNQFLRGNKAELIEWKCRRCGHQWEASILSRAHGYNYCEVCEKKVKYRKVVQCDLGGNEVREYTSSTKAAEELGLVRTKLIDAIIDMTEYNGFLWKIKM